MHYHPAIVPDEYAFAINGITTQERESAAEHWILCQRLHCATQDDCEYQNPNVFRLMLCIERAVNHMEYEQHEDRRKAWERAYKRLHSLRLTMERFGA